jgi:hypothetical protein
METIRSLYRFTVMAATLAIGVMAWRLYGPPASECRRIAARGIEIARSWWSDAPIPASGRANASPRLLPMEPRPAIAGAPLTAPPLVAESPNLPPRRPEAVSGLTSGAVSPVADANAAVAPAVELAAGSTSADSAKHGDRLTELFAQLAELDVQEPQLSAWGKGGRFYRFCCRASLQQSPDFTRHFESIADDPHTAVEEVLAEVSAWRSTPLAAR